MKIENIYLYSNTLFRLSPFLWYQNLSFCAAEFFLGKFALGGN